MTMPLPTNDEMLSHHARMAFSTLEAVQHAATVLKAFAVILSHVLQLENGQVLPSPQVCPAAAPNTEAFSLRR